MKITYNCIAVTVKIFKIILNTYIALWCIPRRPDFVIVGVYFLMKVCIKCGLPKPEEQFAIEKRTGKRIGSCTPCMRIYQKSERERLKDSTKEYKRLYQIENKERLNEISNIYRENHKEERRVYLNAYTTRRRMLTKQRRERDPLFRMSECVRNGVGRAFSCNGWGKKGKSFELLGVDFETVKKHIERQFKKGMSWERRGEIHIDHIVPLSSAKTIEELKILCHYTNLQPLWKIDNLRKNKTIPQVQLKMTI